MQKKSVILTKGMKAKKKFRIKLFTDTLFFYGYFTRICFNMLFCFAWGGKLNVVNCLKEGSLQVIVSTDFHGEKILDFFF